MAFTLTERMTIKGVAADLNRIASDINFACGRDSIRIEGKDSKSDAAMRLYTQQALQLIAIIEEML